MYKIHRMIKERGLWMDLERTVFVVFTVNPVNHVGIVTRNNYNLQESIVVCNLNRWFGKSKRSTNYAKRHETTVATTKMSDMLQLIAKITNTQT